MADAESDSDDWEGLLGHAEESQSDDIDGGGAGTGEETEKKATNTGDAYLDGFVIKPATATTEQQQAANAAKTMQIYVDMWQDAPYPALQYDKQDFERMVKNRGAYLEKYATERSKSKKGKKTIRVPKVDPLTAVPKGGRKLKKDYITGVPPEIKTNKSLAAKVANDEDGGPKHLKRGPAGYMPEKLLLKADKSRD